MSGTIVSSRKRRRSVLQPPSENDVLPELPEDLVVEILPRLPVKSLLRFRCVCKSWKSLISSSNFVNDHLHRSATDPNLRHHRLFGRDGITKLYLSTSLRYLIDNQSSSPPLSDHVSFNVSCNILILGSCNGLICWVDSYFFSNDHYVHYLNPSTRLKSESPCFRHPWRNHSCFTMFGFGYDHLSDSYKTVAIYCDPNAEDIDKKTIVKVYALGGARSWRKMQSFPFVPRFSSFDHSRYCGKLVSGTLNWLAHRPNGSLVVVSVDIAKETCGEVLLPHVVDKSEEVVEHPALWVLRGCLCFSYHFKGAQFVLWQMKLYGATESWTILFNISYIDFGIYHYFHFHPRPFFVLDSRPFFMLDKGELLIENGGDFVLYNPIHNSFKYLQSWSYNIFLEGTIHIDSLVSPCPTSS